MVRRLIWFGVFLIWAANAAVMMACDLKVQNISLELVGGAMVFALLTNAILFVAGGCAVLANEGCRGRVPMASGVLKLGMAFGFYVSTMIISGALNLSGLLDLVWSFSDEPMDCESVGIRFFVVPYLSFFAALVGTPVGLAMAFLWWRLRGRKRASLG